MIPNRRLRYTWVTTECPASVGSVVTVKFRPLGERTEVRLLHEGFPDARTRSDHDAPGWQQILEVQRGDSYRVEVRRVIARPRS